MTKMMAMKRARTGALLAVAAAALLAGCTHRDSIEVGAIPDDYRTNHPIVVGEKEKTLDLPVAASATRMSRQQRQTLAGFMDDYDRDSGPYVSILVPAGSANEAAAGRVADDFSVFLNRQGVPRERIIVQSYYAPRADASAPVRVAYSTVRAYTDKCGRWPEDMLNTADNKHYANFGCASQNNLAAQVANPGDLLGPRKMTEIDAENRGNAIGDYKARGVSGDFRGGSEVEY